MSFLSHAKHWRDTLGEFFRCAFVSRGCKRKIRRLLAILQKPAAAGVLQKHEKHQALSRLGQLARGYRDLRWHDAYALANGRWSPGYLPEDVFYTLVEPALNPFQRTERLCDKNLLALLGFPNLPKVLAHVVRGRLYSPDFRPATWKAVLPKNLNEEVVVKPARATGGGRGVTFILARDVPDYISKLMEARGPIDVIVQECIRQHEILATISPSSVNTYRLLTFRVDGEVRLLSAVLRMGVGSSRVDNSAAGGLACGITSHGELHPFAFDKHFTRYESHPTSQVAFAGMRLPAFEKSVDAALDVHRRLLPDLDLVSWDFAISDQNEPVLIECNVRYQEINFHQLCNGPIFEPYFDAIAKRARGVCLLGLVLPLTRER